MRNYVDEILKYSNYNGHGFGAVVIDGLTDITASYLEALTSVNNITSNWLKTHDTNQLIEDLTEVMNNNELICNYIVGDILYPQLEKIITPLNEIIEDLTEEGINTVDSLLYTSFGVEKLLSSNGLAYVIEFYKIDTLKRHLNSVYDIKEFRKSEQVNNRIRIEITMESGV